VQPARASRRMWWQAGRSEGGCTRQRPAAVPCAIVPLLLPAAGPPVAGCRPGALRQGLLGVLSPCLLKRRHHGLARLGPRLSSAEQDRTCSAGGQATGSGWLACRAARLVADVAGEPSIFFQIRG
jgi:hypothetical protein